MAGNVQAGGGFDPSRDMNIAGQLQVQGPMGYGPAGLAIGSTVTQQTNRTTGVNINALCGAITTNNASLAAEAAAAFVVTNPQVSIGDVVVVCQRSGSNGGNTDLGVYAVTNGSFTINVANNNASGGTAETGAIIINFLVLKGQTT